MEQKRKIEHGEASTKDTRALITQLVLLHSDLDDEHIVLLSLLGPWRPSRIPFEILCEIFLYASESDRMFPWTAMAVCRAWRRAAIGCPALWSVLHIGGHLEPSTEDITKRCLRFFYKDRSLTTPMAVQKAIRRTRGGRLEISIHVEERMAFCRDCLMQCLDLVGRQLERWQSLVLSIDEDWVNLGPMLAGSLSNLRTFYTTNCSSGLMKALASRAPFLHTIEYSGTTPQGFACCIGQPFWPHLRKLKLGFVWCDDRLLQCLSSLLTSCTALHSLELCMVHRSAPRVPSPPIIWPPDMSSFTRLTCTMCLPSLVLLSGMRITILYITVWIRRYLFSGEWNPGDWTTRGMGKIHLPKLQHLTCQGLQTSLAAAELFDAPSLVDLVIESLSSFHSDCLADLEKPWRDSSLQPRNVTLHWVTFCTHNDLVIFLPMLRSLRDIQYLTLRGIPIADAEVFARPQTQHLCPKLNSIAWCFTSDADDVKDVQESFYDAAYKRYGGPQTHWTVAVEVGGMSSRAHRRCRYIMEVSEGISKQTVESI